MDFRGVLDDRNGDCERGELWLLTAGAPRPEIAFPTADAAADDIVDDVRRDGPALGTGECLPDAFGVFNTGTGAGVGVAATEAAAEGWSSTGSSSGQFNAMRQPDEQYGKMEHDTVDTHTSALPQWEHRPFAGIFRSFSASRTRASSSP